ncbi:MAG TPA: 30S ribosomal protein S8 [Phycisphaerae bacterium]|nr:30S ribosomal protein S8 [Phycisphaerae bacterium]
MSLSDPIADMLTRVRNAVRTHSQVVTVKASRICEGVVKVLKDAGYVTDFKKIDDGNQGQLRIYLKYGPTGQDVIIEIKRISKPSRRVYASAKEVPQPLNGLGIAVVSTSQGILSDQQCRDQNVGGEVLCTVS